MVTASPLSPKTVPERFQFNKSYCDQNIFSLHKVEVLTLLHSLDTAEEASAVR
jgi:hypothetical protein